MSDSIESKTYKKKMMEFFYSVMGLEGMNLFPTLLESYSNLEGYGLGGVWCCFPSDFDDWEEDYYGETGVKYCFDYPAVEEDCTVVLSYEEFYSYLAEAAEKYVRMHEDKKTLVQDYLIKIRSRIVAHPVVEGEPPVFLPLNEEQYKLYLKREAENKEINFEIKMMSAYYFKYTHSKDEDSDLLTLLKQHSTLHGYGDHSMWCRFPNECKEGEEEYFGGNGVKYIFQHTIFAKDCSFVLSYESFYKYLAAAAKDYVRMNASKKDAVQKYLEIIKTRIGIV